MSARAPMSRVGFIGLGNMGGRMTAAIVRSGIPVLGYDPVDGRAQAAGATAAGSVADVVAQSDVVLLSLPDSSVVESVMHAADGILASAAPGDVFVDLSTSDPESTVRLEAALRSRGAAYLDAGISGGAAAAEAGTLTLMVGGDEAVLADLRWLLQAISSNVFHMGAIGSGHVAKLLNNFLNAISLSATAEVMVAAKKAGLDLGTFLDVLNVSSGVNFATQKRFPSIVKGDYLEGGLSTRLMTKDIVLYIRYLAAKGVSSLNASGPLASFGLASALGYGEQISNRVVDAFGDVSGGIRLSDAEGTR
ncbi:3-hydroxyisobutyrate dehydrogenase [Okibacterium endophyticum]